MPKRVFKDAFILSKKHYTALISSYLSKKKILLGIICPKERVFLANKKGVSISFLPVVKAQLRRGSCRIEVVLVASEVRKG